MNFDTMLTYAAIATEAAILIALVALCVRSASYRKYAILALGSIAPIGYFYISTIAEFLRNPTDPSVRFAFYAMWIMGFGFFLVCVGVGLAVAQSPRPTDLKLRFLLGASITSGLYGLITILG